MAVIHHLTLGVEADVPDMQVAGFCVQPRPGWIAGPAPWPRDDFGVAHKPDVDPPLSDDDETQRILDEISAAADAANTPPTTRDNKD